jgi:phosphoribosylformimino-5-aminoimidazole carboxamide ribotide isomerase
MSLIVFPAIDLRHGEVVRLRQGNPAAQTVFDNDPVIAARRWESAGAVWLHIVNLDGALGSETNAPSSNSVGLRVMEDPGLNLRALTAVRAATSLPIQFGGGIRSLRDAAIAIESGASRVILGTAAVEHPEVVSEILKELGPSGVVVALDARDGKVSTHGWQSVSSAGVLDLAHRMRALGVERVLYTDVARDGMLSGVDVEGTAELARQSGLRVIASGGVATLSDIRELALHRDAGIEGVVVGQAIYSGTLDLRAAIAAGSE